MSKKAKHPLSLSLSANPLVRHELFIKVALVNVLENAVYLALFISNLDKSFHQSQRAPVIIYWEMNPLPR